MYRRERNSRTMSTHEREYQLVVKRPLGCYMKRALCRTAMQLTGYSKHLQNLIFNARLERVAFPEGLRGKTGKNMLHIAGLIIEAVKEEGGSLAKALRRIGDICVYIDDESLRQCDMRDYDREALDAKDDELDWEQLDAKVRAEDQAKEEALRAAAAAAPAPVSSARKSSKGKAPGRRSPRATPSGSANPSHSSRKIVA